MEKEVQMTKLQIFASAFLDGFSGAGLYRRLRQPGAATQVFADPVEEECEVVCSEQTSNGKRTALSKPPIEALPLGR